MGWTRGWRARNSWGSLPPLRCGLGQVTSPLCLSFLICKMRVVTLVVPTYLPGVRRRLLARTRKARGRCKALSKR